MKSSTSEIELGKEIHYHLYQLSLDNSFHLIDLPIEVKNHISKLEGKYHTLYWALKKVSKTHKAFSEDKDGDKLAYELLYGKKIQGRKVSSITLEEKVRDFYHIDEILNLNKSFTLEDAIKKYLEKLGEPEDANSSKFLKYRKRYYEIKSPLEKFLNSLR